MSAVTEDRASYRASFERFAAAHADDPTWLRERRTAAMARFVEKGLPTARDDAWRHTPVAPIVKGRFEAADPGARVVDATLSHLPDVGGPRAVLVNGRLSPELSRLGGAPPGVELRSLREALRLVPGRLEPWLGRIADGRTGVFADLNTAFAEDGAVLIVAPGTIAREPVHVVHVTVGAEAPVVAYSRVLVAAGRGSECTLVESFVSPGGGGSLSNAATEVVAEDNAFVDRCKLQREDEQALHVSTLAVRLGRDARFADHAVSLGAALSRNDLDVRFDAEGGECELLGLFALDKRRVADTHSTVDHARPHCSSRQLYRGIVDEQARGVFDGLVVVRAGAQKTDASQMNRNLLLSREALVHSTPRLEILADDVKCKHGSTTGQLDPAALFYLRSRGLSEAAARSLLTWAFASDLVRRLRVEPVRRAVERHLAAHLPAVAGLEEALA